MARVRGSGRGRRQRARRVRIGERDRRLTGCAGVEAVREVDRVLGLTAALERGVGAVKARRRGLSGGQLLTALASAQLTGADFLVRLDERREDVAGQQLEPVPTPASTTAAGIARRFGAEQLRGIEAAIGQVNARLVELVGQVRRSALLKVATIDGDTTDVEVFGRLKEKAAYSHGGSAICARTSGSGPRPGCRWPAS